MNSRQPSVVGRTSRAARVLLDPLRGPTTQACSKAGQAGREAGRGPGGPPHFVFPLWLLLSTALLAAAQPAFRAQTQLVQVSVIAQDQQGKPVADLRREEFQILDNNSPQEIRLFLSETERSNAASPEPKAPGTFTNQIAPRSGYSVIAFDTLVTEVADTGGSGAVWAKGKALQMLRTLPPDDTIAIYATGKKLQVIGEFTRDRESLERQLRAWKPSVDTPEIGRASCSDVRPHGIGDCIRHDALRRVAGTGDELGQIAEHLAGIPGRKNLIWIAYQFPMSPATVQKLKNANIALYPVDAHGSTIALPRDKSELSAPLRALAAMTGGVAYFDRDDLDVAIREALEDGRISYTLGFYPSADDRASQIHQLAVRVSRPGVTLRYRTSYQIEAPRPASANPKADLTQALNRPIDATAIPIRASVVRTGDRLNLETTLDIPSLELTPKQNLWTGTIDVVARFTAADGSLAGEVFYQTMALNLRQTTYDKAVRSGFVYHNQLTIPAKAVELTLLFANRASGKLGTLTIPLSEIEAGTGNAK
jgi:VWFA-related protein